MRIDYSAINPPAIQSMVAAKGHMDSIGKDFRALLELRVSQINGCSYCVDLHTREARAHGENQQRLDCLVVWRETSFFSEAERAALNWADAVTQISKKGAPEQIFETMKQHDTDTQIVDITLIVSQMNAWNRMAISFEHGPTAR